MAATVTIAVVVTHSYRYSCWYRSDEASMQENEHNIHTPLGWKKSVVYIDWIDIPPKKNAEFSQSTWLKSVSVCACVSEWCDSCRGWKRRCVRSAPLHPLSHARTFCFFRSVDGTSIDTSTSSSFWFLVYSRQIQYIYNTIIDFFIFLKVPSISLWSRSWRSSYWPSTKSMICCICFIAITDNCCGSLILNLPFPGW